MNKKRNILGLILALILLMTQLSFAEVRIDMPNTLTEGIPYKATLVVNEPTLQKYTKEIRYTCSNCYVYIKEEDKLKDISYIDLRGRDKIDFYIIGEYDRSDETITGTVSDLELTFIVNATEIKKDFPDENYFSGKGATYTKYFGTIKSKRDFTLPSLPSDTDSEFEYDEFFGQYTFRDSQKRENYFSPVPMLLFYLFEANDQICFRSDRGYNQDCYNRYFSDEDIEKSVNDEGLKIEKLSLLGGEGHYLVWDSVGSIKDVTDDEGNHLYNIATVNVGMNFAVFNDANNQMYSGSCQKKADVKEGDQDSFVDETIADCKSVLNTYVRTPVGSAPIVPQDIFEYNLPDREDAKTTIEYDDLCETDSDCEDGLSCTACGECKKSKDVFDVNDVEVEFKLSNKLSSKSIFNRIHNRILFTTTIDPKFIVDGKNVDYCELSAPGIKDYEFVSEMKNEDSYAGFIYGWVLDERRNEDRRVIDFTLDKIEISSLVSPKDRKKQ